jgi:hypothetical protein
MGAPSPFAIQYPFGFFDTRRRFRDDADGILSACQLHFGDHLIADNPEDASQCDFLGDIEPSAPAVSTW